MSDSTYTNRKKAGLCVKCGKTKEVKEKVMCSICAEKQRVYQKETRDFLKRMGLCPRCGDKKLFGDEKECPECLAKMYEVNKRSKMNRNFNNSEFYKKDIKILKEKGLCRSCRKKKVKEGHTYCEICLIKKRERARIYRRKKDKLGIDRNERPNYGFCYICAEELDRDGRICKKCSERATSNLPETRDNKYWREQNKIIFNR